MNLSFVSQCCRLFILYLAQGIPFPRRSRVLGVRLVVDLSQCTNSDGVDYVSIWFPGKLFGGVGQTPLMEPFNPLALMRT